MIRSGVTGIDRSRRIKDPKAVLVGYTHSSTKVVSVETVCQVCHTQYQHQKLAPSCACHS